MTGRPSLDDSAVVDELCARIIAGEGIKAICRDDDMPAHRTVYERMAADEAFRTRIARAREAQQEALIDETVEMADAATVEDHQVVKLRIWARQWRASKLAPKKYGDKLDATIGNPDGTPIQERSPREIAMAVLSVIRAAQTDDNGQPD
jgi:hypothetical protein